MHISRERRRSTLMVTKAEGRVTGTAVQAVKVPAIFSSVPVTLGLMMSGLLGCSGDPGDATPTPEASPTAAVTPTEAPTAAPTATPPLATPTPEQTPANTPTATPELTPEPTPYPPVAYTLSAPVEVILDQVGVPHIYANTNGDAVWAQGYFAMRDRMWQMDFNRRVAGGRTAELLGESYYEIDLLYRALDFEPLAAQIYESLKSSDPELVEILEAYAAGANAYLDAAISERDGASLSPQVEALGYVPEPWHPIHTLMIDKLLIFNLSTNIEIDLAVTLVSQALGADISLDLIRPQPVDPTVIVPNFYQDSPPVESKNGPSARLEGWNLTEAQIRTVLAKLDTMRSISDMYQGSNNWVVGPEHTSTGSPMISEDTHEGVEAPATYHQVHLSSVDGEGTLDVIGYNFPGAPLVAFGHNEYSAWAVTNNFADVNELFQETVRNGKVSFNGEQVALETRTEVIKVRAGDGTVEGAEPRVIEMSKVPHHGPVLPEEVTGVPLTLSVGWTGFRNVHSISLLLGMAEARTYSDFEATLRTFKVGAQNFMFATVDGDYGYAARTDIPIRANLSPACAPIGIVKGTGECEWTGSFVPDEDIPQTRTPARGFIVSANNDPGGTVQDNDVYNDPVYTGSVYDNGLRAFRIEQLLQETIDAGTPITFEEFARVQGDNQSRLALHMVPFVLIAADAHPELITGDLAEAVALLREWDYHTDEDAGASLLFHTWIAFVLRDVFADETIGALFDDLSNDYVNMLTRPLIYFLELTKDTIYDIEAGTQPFPSASRLNYFDNQDTDFLETRDAVLIDSLRKTVEYLVTAKGAVSSWTWGANHQITFNDRVGAYLPEASVGPFDTDGGLFTVDPAEFRLNRGGVMEPIYDVTGGPSQRTFYSLVPNNIEVWDIQPGGASERPGDPHFMDQVEQYLANDYRVRPFYRAAVEAAETDRLTLTTDGSRLLP